MSFEVGQTVQLTQYGRTIGHKTVIHVSDHVEVENFVTLAGKEKENVKFDLDGNQIKVTGEQHRFRLFSLPLPVVVDPMYPEVGTRCGHRIVHSVLWGNHKGENYIRVVSSFRSMDDGWDDWTLDRWQTYVREIQTGVRE